MPMAMPMLPPTLPQHPLPEIETFYRAPLLLPTPAYYPAPIPARQQEYEQPPSGVKGGSPLERQPELPRPVLSLGPQTLAYVLVRPIQQHHYQYLEPLRYASRYQTYPRPIYQQIYRAEDKGIKGIQQQTESFEQQPQQFEEQRLEPTPYEPQQPISQQAQAAAGELLAKKTSKFAGLRSSLSKIASKLQPISSYQVMSEEYLLPQQPIQQQPIQQQPIQQQPIQQQPIEPPQQQQLEQLPQIEQQQKTELDVKGGEHSQERLPEAEDLRQTKEGQHPEKLDESLKTKRDRVLKAATAAQAPVAQAEDKNHGF